MFYAAFIHNLYPLERHPEGRKLTRVFTGPVQARSWPEWADQRVSSPEGPCVSVIEKNKYKAPKKFGTRHPILNIRDNVDQGPSPSRQG
jgi:hypothetical protein